ncbi:MAG TPA: J domain-containing protein [Polyangia bacterium]
MSISRRLIDLARSNLNALLDKAAPETSIDELTDQELQAELERRKERRRREEEERKSRESAERAARDRAAQRQATQKSAPRSASTQAPRSSPKRPPPPGPTRRPPPPRPAPPGTERRLRDLYAQLEVPYGADFETVKHSFRRLMRKYHPDLHVGNPAKQKAATELTMSLTQAYDELEHHLRKR